MEELIVAKAKELFFFYGFKSVSMDDLAKAAAVSKKTIYLYFSDKNQVLDSVINSFIAEHDELFLKSQKKAGNAVEEVCIQSSEPFNLLAGISYSFFHDLEKSFPAAWEKLIRYRQERVLPAIIKNLKRGICENIFRPEIDILFVAQIRLQQLNTALNPAGFGEAESDPISMMNEFTGFYLHGITNEVGKKLINNYLKNKDELYALK